MTIKYLITVPLKIVTIAVFIVLSCFAYSYPQSNTLRFTEDAQYSKLVPYDSPTERANTGRIFALIFEPLFSFDYNSETYTDILVEDVIDEGGGEYIIKLKNGVKWHDGEAFTAEDVEFTLNHVMDFSRQEAIKDQLNNLIDNIEVSNDFTVAVTLKSNNVDIRNALSFIWMLPEHLFQDNIAPSSFTKKPVGTGPFQLTEEGIGGVKFDKFDEYHGLQRDINSIVRQQTIDLDARITELLSGSTDLLINVPANRVRQIEERDRHRMIPYQSFSISTIAFNLDREPLNQKTIRKAMALGFNRENVLDTWYDGRGSLIGGPYTPNSPYFNPDVQPLPYDPDRAKSLLNEAGFTNTDGSGILRNNQNEILEFELVTRDLGSNTNDPSLRNVVQDFIEQMSRIGIKINITNLTFDDHQERVFRDNDFDLAILEIFFDPTYDISPLFYSNSSFSEFNVGGYQNDAVDARFESFFDSESRSEKLQLMGSVQEIIYEDIPYIFMFSLERNAAVHYRFYNTKVDPFNFFNEVNLWRVQEI